MEAESGEEGFHESGGRQRLDDEAVLSKMRKEVACNVDTMRARLVEGAGAGAVRRCSIHSHLLTMADLGRRQQPDGQRLQCGKKKQGSRGQRQMLRESHQLHDF